MGFGWEAINLRRSKEDTGHRRISVASSIPSRNWSILLILQLTNKPNPFLLPSFILIDTFEVSLMAILRNSGFQVIPLF